MPNIIDEEEKIKWLLEKKNIAQNRANSLENAAENMNKYPNAKVAVGGGGGNGRGKSDQEKYLDNKEELQELASQLRHNAEYIEEVVAGLSKNKRIVIEGNYFHELKPCVLKNRIEPNSSARQVRRIRDRAIDDLEEGRILVVYSPMKNLLEIT